jgi:hypothetical protein
VTTLRTVKQIAKSLGAAVEDGKDGHVHECRVEAPHRKRWAEGSVHEMVDGAYIPWKPDYADLISRMQHGLEDCIGPCEWCDGE